MKRLAMLVAVGLTLAWTGDSSAVMVLHEFVGDSNGDRFGNSVSGGVEINNDGVPDVIVGASLDDNNGSISGMVRVFSGATGGILYSIDGDGVGDVLGQSVAGVSDVDGDAHDDFIIGAVGDDNNGINSGSVRIISGRTGGVLFLFDGDATKDRLGQSVADAGDVNGDLVNDVIAGAVQDDFFNPGTGYARAYSGADGSTLYTFVGDAQGDIFGECVGGVGDINGDDRSDVVVGAERFEQGVPGYARVFSGMDGSVLHEFTGTANDDEFGRACAGVGDVNKDGVPDLIVGAIQRNTGGGYARVFSGADGSVLYTFFGRIATDRFGNSVDGVGDMDGDGYDDVIVGAPSPDPIIPVAGAKAREKSGLPGYARVFSGRTGEILMEVSTTASKDGLGVSVSGAGDLNGDAVPDFIAGAWQDQNGLPGFARVYAGERPAPPGCAPVNVTTSALGVAAFAAVAGVLALMARRRRIGASPSP